MRVLLALLLSASPAAAGDWPQLLGPNRDGVAAGEKPLTELPESAEPLWTAPAGEGFAGPAVAGGVAYLLHRVGDALRLEARDAATGERRWRADAPDDYDRPGFISDRGPRATPVVTDPALLGEPHARVLSLGSGGLLRCHSAADGSELWRVDVTKKYRGDLGYFGLGATPLVVGDGAGGAVVVVVPGGFRSGAGVVGLDLKTGAERWTAARAKPCYGSPVLTTVDDKPLAIVPTRVTLYGLDPLSGDVLWEIPFGAQGPTAIGANPVVLPAGDGGKALFLSSNYSTGDVYATFDRTRAEVAYNGDFVLATHYATPIQFPGGDGGGFLFGLSGQENHGPASFACVAPASRTVLWKERGVGYGTLLGVPGAKPGTGSILKLGLDGELILFFADRTRYRELGRLRLFPATGRGEEVRAAPAYSGGVLFARDGQTWKAVRLRD